jgi:hypothetical protein
MRATKDKIDFNMFCRFSMTPALYNKMKFSGFEYEDGKDQLKPAHLNLKLASGQSGSKKKIKLTPSE